MRMWTVSGASCTPAAGRKNDRRAPRLNRTAGGLIAADLRGPESTFARALPDQGIGCWSGSRVGAVGLSEPAGLDRHEPCAGVPPLVLRPRRRRGAPFAGGTERPDAAAM